jgi:hypothetical protein
MFHPIYEWNVICFRTWQHEVWLYKKARIHIQLYLINIYEFNIFQMIVTDVIKINILFYHVLCCMFL